MVHTVSNITVPALGYSMPTGGKMSLEVDPSSLIYSHFEHVSGIAAPDGVQGAAISKLNLLDVLIGQLNQIKRGSVDEIRAFAAPENMDSLIESYNNQIRQAKLESSIIPYINSSGAQSGALFSLLV